MGGTINPSLLSLFNNNQPTASLKVANTVEKVAHSHNNDNQHVGNNNNSDSLHNNQQHHHNHHHHDKKQGQETPSEKRAEEQPKSEETKKKEEEKKPEPVSLFGNLKIPTGGLFASLNMPFGTTSNATAEKKDSNPFPLSMNLFSGLGSTGLFSSGTSLNQGLLDSTPKRN